MVTMPTTGHRSYLNVRVGRPALELEDQDTCTRQHEHDQHERDEERVLAAVLDYVINELALPLAAQHFHDARQATESGEAQESCDAEDAQAGDRAQEIEPAALVDEVFASRTRPSQVVDKVREEHDADQVVVNGQRIDRGRAQRQE